MKEDYLSKINVYIKWWMCQILGVDTAKIISFSKCFVSCFSCLAQGSASSLPYH